MDFPVSLDPSLETPIYRQLSNAMRTAITSGRLKPGDLLPSTPEMSRMLGLARATVVKSYDDLEGQGFLETVSGKGTFVSRNLPEHVLRPALTAVASRYLEQEPPTELLSEYARTLLRVPFVRSTSADRPELNYGSAPLDQLPLRQWRELLIAHSRSASADTYTYVTEPFGHRPLREAIANYLARSKAVRCLPEQVIIFPGSQHPLYHVA